MPSLNALLFASFGNVLAIVVNYFLGYWLYEKTKTKLKKSSIGRKTLYLGYKYGYGALLFSWLPIIGDPITLVAGYLRMNFFAFFLIAGTMRVARYTILLFVL